MKRFIAFTGILFFLLVQNSLAHFNAKGHVHNNAKKVQTFLNADCVKNGTCDLKRFTVTSTSYEVWFRDDPLYPTFGNGVVMEYETDSPDSLEKYAVVQFIRGGEFYSSKNAFGEIEKNTRSVIGSFGENVPFFFPDWVIDSHDEDPAYNSDPDDGRFYYLRWNKVAGSYDLNTQKYYGAEKPKIPIVYLTDYPSGAFVSEAVVKNTAMEFKSCIYKASNVPLKSTKKDINIAEPIACFEWQNIYVYDYAAEKFRTDRVDILKLLGELNK